MRWACFSQWPYRRGYALTRDLAILSIGLKNLGEDCQYFMLDGGEPCDDPNIRLISLENVCSVSWWKSIPADVVVMMAGARKLEPIYNAVRGAGKKLIMRMDNDGRLSPLQDIAGYFSGCMVYSIDQVRLKDRDSGWLRGFYLAAARTFACTLLAKWFNARVSSRLAMADLLLTETPVGGHRLQAFLRSYGYSTKVRWSPPAVFLSPAVSGLKAKKEKRIVCVAQWWRYQKDIKLTSIAIKELLLERKDYHVTFVGDESDRIWRFIDKSDRDLCKRIEVQDRIPRKEIDEYYVRSQILFLASRGEGFPNVAAEASCFGCTIVGWAGITAFEYFSSRGAGLTSFKRTQEALSQALLSEITAWENGWRDPDAIADQFRKEFSPVEAAKKLVDAFGIKDTPDSPPSSQ